MIEGVHFVEQVSILIVDVRQAFTIVTAFVHNQTIKNEVWRMW